MCPYYITISYHTLTLLNTVPYLEEDGTNWPTFAPHFQEAMKASYWRYSARQQKSTSFLAPEPELFQKNRV